MRFGVLSVALSVGLMVGACGGGEPEAESEAAPTDSIATGSEGIASTGHDTPTASGSLTVVFTNNIDGEIEPCG